MTLLNGFDWVWPLDYEPSLPDYPGQFGAIRKYDIHTGVDLYCPEGTIVKAAELGIVVNIENFTGPEVNSPWWNSTKAVLIEGKSGVICYGELEPVVAVGDHLNQGEEIGRVKTVLKKNKGKPMTMLHIELYTHGTMETVIWDLNKNKPKNLLNPTEHLKNAIQVQKRSRGIYFISSR